MQRTSQTSTPAAIEGIDIPPAVFAGRLAFIEAVKSGVSGSPAVRQAGIATWATRVTWQADWGVTRDGEH